jgi:hypothetical protein
MARRNIVFTPTEDVVPSVIIVILTLLWGPWTSQDGLQQLNVSGIQCQRIAKDVTPRMVELDVDKYVETCVQWVGRVDGITDADYDDMKVWVKPIEGKFAYCGSTLLTIHLWPSGKKEDPSTEPALPSCDFLYSFSYSGIQRGDHISFTGKILGVSKTPSPTSKTRFIERALIGIIEMHKVQ